MHFLSGYLLLWAKCIALGHFSSDIYLVCGVNTVALKAVDLIFGLTFLVFGDQMSIPGNIFHCLVTKGYSHESIFSLALTEDYSQFSFLVCFSLAIALVIFGTAVFALL